MFQGLSRPRILLGDEFTKDGPFAMVGSNNHPSNNSLQALQGGSGDLQRTMSANLDDPPGYASPPVDRAIPSLPASSLQGLGVGGLSLAPGLTEPQANAMGIPDEMFRTLRRATAEASTEGYLLVF